MEEKEKVKAKWGIDISNLGGIRRWSVGVSLNHDKPETYIFISFWKWSITIGKIIKFED